MMKLDGVKGIWKKERSGGRGPSLDKPGVSRRPRVLLIQITLNGVSHYLDHPLLDEAHPDWPAEMISSGSVVAFAAYCRVRLMQRLHIALMIGRQRAPSTAEVEVANLMLNNFAALDKAAVVVDDLFRQLQSSLESSAPTKSRLRYETLVRLLDVHSKEIAELKRLVALHDLALAGPVRPKNPETEAEVRASLDLPPV